MKFLLGTKAHMTRIFQEDGSAVPVTKISAGPCTVTSVKTKERDGYTAVQIGYGTAKHIKKPQAGHLKGLPQVKHLREFRTETTEGVDRGATITVETFNVGDKVKVVGVNKGKGFQGVVRRHGFGGSPASHGHKDQLRMPGSIGATDAARVFKGVRMGGHMGNVQTTVANLEVVKVDTENNELYLKGAVPGSRGSLIEIVCGGDLVLTKVEEAKAEQPTPEAEEVAAATPEETKEEVKEVAKEEEKEAKADTADAKDEKQVEEKDDKKAEEKSEKNNDAK